MPSEYVSEQIKQSALTNFTCVDAEKSILSKLLSGSEDAERWVMELKPSDFSNVDYGMIVFMMTLSFFIPVCGLFCMLTDYRTKFLRMVNAVLAVLIGLFNLAHVFMELPSENAGQYVIMPMMIVIGLALAWHSVKYVKEG